MSRRKKIKRLIENNRWLKRVPNTLTIGNSLCGFAAILYTLRVYEYEGLPGHVLAVSAWIVLFAMVFDTLDGLTARIFNATSLKGLQMDSLADMVTFGMAPAVIVSVMAHCMRPAILPELKPYQYFIIWGFCAIYIACAASRLATYNVHALLEKKSGDKFNGLPTPGAAAAICSLVILYSVKEGELRQIISFLPWYAAVLGLLMVSNIQYQHFGKWLTGIPRRKRRAVPALAVLACFVVKPDLTIAVLVNGYVLSGPVLTVLGLIFNRRPARSADAPILKKRDEKEDL